jgi:hypothetical protein
MDPTATPDPGGWNYPPAQRRPAPPSAYPSAAQPPATQYQVPPQGWATAQPQYSVAALPNTRVNGFAIASLVFGICGGLLLSVIFGIVALVQIKNNGGRGKGMAIAGLALSGLYVLAFGVVIAIGVLQGADRDPVSGQVTQGGSVSLDDLRPGDCIEDLAKDELAYSVSVVPCAQPHRSEVTAVESLIGDVYPGDEAVDVRSGSRCADAAVRYAPTAVEAGEVEVRFFRPTRDSWARGDRSVICLVDDPVGTRTGSVAG